MARHQFQKQIDTINEQFKLKKRKIKIKIDQAIKDGYKLKAEEFVTKLKETHQEMKQEKEDLFQKISSDLIKKREGLKTSQNERKNTLR